MTTTEARALVAKHEGIFDDYSDTNLYADANLTTR